MLTTRLWIDGSSLAFIHGNKKNYKETIYNHIKTLTERFHTDDFNIILEDSKTNFRNKVSISSVYKGQRRTKKKKKAIATYLPYLKNWFREIKNTYDPITYLNVENDDAIAILASRISNSVMIANDRDYLAVPGIYYNIKTNKTAAIETIIENKVVIKSCSFVCLMSNFLSFSHFSASVTSQGLGFSFFTKVLS